VTQVEGTRTHLYCARELFQLVETLGTQVAALLAHLLQSRELSLVFRLELCEARMRAVNGSPVQQQVLNVLEHSLVVDERLRIVLSAKDASQISLLTRRQIYHARVRRV